RNTEESENTEAKHIPTFSTQNTSNLTDDLYNQIKASKSVSEVWTLAQEFKNHFSQDNRLEEVMARAAQMHFDYAIRIHGEGRYEAATMYYNRLLNEDLTPVNIKSETAIYV